MYFGKIKFWIGSERISAIFKRNKLLKKFGLETDKVRLQSVAKQLLRKLNQIIKKIF